MLGTKTLPDMYCFCDSTHNARPINGEYGDSYSQGSSNCFDD